MYADPVVRGNTGWPASVIVEGVPDVESVTAALQTGPYGRCVYECDNDVCDNQVRACPPCPPQISPCSDRVGRRLLPLLLPQVVNFEFSNGATASFTMVAHTELICERQTRLHFAYGELVGDMNTFTVTDFRTGESTQHAPKNEGGAITGQQRHTFPHNKIHLRLSCNQQ